MQLDADDISTRRTASAGAAAYDDAPAKPERDWKRTILIAGLGILSWVATYVGMLELIEANMGDLPLIHKAIIGFSVAMLMTMIIWLLDQLFKPHPFMTKVFYASGYVFLSLISIGFGFGFYWKVLESRGESTRSAESAVSQVQNSLHAASTRLEQLSATLVQLTGVSTSKAELERVKGHLVPELEAGRWPAPQNARGRCTALFVCVRVRQWPRRRRQGRDGRAERRPRQDRISGCVHVRRQNRHAQRIHAQRLAASST